MTISELIERLEALKAEHGELIVKVQSIHGEREWVDPDPYPEVDSNWLLL